MKARVLIAVVCLLFTLITTAYPSANMNDLAIKTLERELENALLKGDVKTLDRILADNYMEIDARGGVTGKRDVIKLARMRSSASPATSIGPDKTVDEISTRFYENTAIVAGRTTIRYPFMEYQTTPPKSRFQNPVLIDQERFLRVYAKVKGTWKLVSSQTTSIAKR